MLYIKKAITKITSVQARVNEDGHEINFLRLKSNPYLY